MADSEEKKPKKTRKRQRMEETIRAGDAWEARSASASADDRVVLPMPTVPVAR